MALSDEDAAELAGLKAARTKALKGEHVTRFVYNGQQTDYGDVPVERLEARIAALEAEAALPASSCRPKRGAIRFRL